MSIPKRFPVMHQHLPRALRSPNCPASIPWSVIEPHAAQALQNHDGQTLERLAERGGLSPLELLAVLNNTHWRVTLNLPPADAVKQLRDLLELRSPDCYCSSPEASAHPCYPGTCPNAS